MRKKSWKKTNTKEDRGSDGIPEAESKAVARKTDVVLLAYCRNTIGGPDNNG